MFVEKEVQSTAIKRVAYDEVSLILRITFQQDRAYDYPNVPKDEFEKLIKAESVGKYFNQHIKPYSVNYAPAS